MLTGFDRDSPNTGAPNFYDLLRIQPTASADEIKEAYRQLAEMYFDSPDLLSLSGNSPSDEFALITRAFRVLSDERQRSEYDSQLSLSQDDLAPADCSLEESQDSVSETYDPSHGDLPEEWRKERQYFEEHFEEIFKPLPKVDLVGPANLPEAGELATIDANLEDWEVPERTPEEESSFGTLPAPDHILAEKAIPQARRVIPYPTVDPFQLVIGGGIILMGLIIIAEIVYLYGG